MAVLSNFLPVRELSKEKIEALEKHSTKLKEFQNAVNVFTKTFKCNIGSEDSELSKFLFKREEPVYQQCWNDVGFVPFEFAESIVTYPSNYKNNRADEDILHYKKDYNYLCDLSVYPVTEIGKLKALADALGFVIIPSSYVNLDKVVDMYGKQDFKYRNKIVEAYNEFVKVSEKCVKYTGYYQQYILAPISFYDPWLEVKSEEVKPKYFSRQLNHISSVLGLIIPTQKNLYNMIKTNEENLKAMNNTMQENFKIIQQTLDDVQKRMEWLEDAQRTLGKLNKRQNNLELKMSKEEEQILFMLDPIVFNVAENVDVSNSDYDMEIARVGICFGLDMPLDFFVQRGLVEINDKRFDKFTYPFKI